MKSAFRYERDQETAAGASAGRPAGTSSPTTPTSSCAWPAIRASGCATSPAAVGITERAPHRILSELVDEGYVRRERHGRRNRYEVLPDLPLAPPAPSRAARSATCSPSWAGRRRTASASSTAFGENRERRHLGRRISAEGSRSIQLSYRGPEPRLRLPEPLDRRRPPGNPRRRKPGCAASSPAPSAPWRCRRRTHRATASPSRYSST